jgi:cytochrome c-type biogenesis protein CcmE
MKPKFLLGGSLIAAAAILLIVTSMASTMQYFLTVTQLRDKGTELIGQSARVAGAVIIDSVVYELRDGEPHLEFDVVDSEDQIGQQTPLRIVYHGPKPDLLKPHAQAIVEGQLTADGKFVADTLLLKCPTRYEDQFPQQVQGS